MTRALMSAFLLAAAAPGVFGQAEGRRVRQAGGDAAARTLARADREFTLAISRNDTAALKRILSDDLTLTASGGLVIGKARWIEIVETGARRYKSYETDDLVVRAYGDAGVVTGRADVTELAGGQEFPGRYRFTRVYVRRGGRWRVVAIQLTALPRQ